MGGISFLARKSVHKDSPTASDVHVDSIMGERKRRLQKKRMLMEAALQKGDYPGHPFRGNQWTGGRGAGASRGRGRVSADAMAAKQKSMKQMMAEFETLTPAQQKKYHSSPAHYDHDQSMKRALSTPTKRAPSKKTPRAAPKTAPKANTRPSAAAAWA